MMERITEKLAEFATEVKFDDLPPDVIYEMKRLLLDTVGCVLGGISTEKGSIAVSLARRLGGPPESTIIGKGDKVSCTNAAWANGQLANALDFDALGAGHDVPFVIPSSLAMGECTQASGEELILAIAIGLEVGRRITRVSPGNYPPVPGGPDKGKIAWPPVFGYTASTFGAAVSAAKILSLNQEKMTHAIAIAGYICAPDVFRKWSDSTPIGMTKQGLFGWGAQAGVTSALLADMGYTGDKDLFQGPYCFWRYTGKEKWNTEHVLDGLGSEWGCHHMSYKFYPMGRCLPGAVDNFMKLISENNLQPEDIGKVTAMVHPLAQFRMVSENELVTADDYLFNLRYAIACAANRFSPAHWPNAEVREDPRIREFLRRVDIVVTSNDREYGLALLEDPEARPSSIEMIARGKTFTAHSKYIRGSWRPEEFRMTDEELKQKFRDNASRVLTMDKIDRTVEMVFELEKLENTVGLMELIA